MVCPITASRNSPMAMLWGSREWVNHASYETSFGSSYRSRIIQKTFMSDELYETIGGGDTVSAAIKSFYDRVLRDEGLKPFFDSSDMVNIRSRQSMFVSMLLGGKIVYTGKDIGLSHSNVRIQGLTDEHFDAFLKHFR